ncbi:MAG: CBS domain-containing protein, partial [Desulfobacula sp.]|nr:CBS domain-containing protein [Desulfobacula sp.]
IVVVQDLIKGVIIPGRSPDEVHVYEIMTKPIITVPADMDVRYVARLINRAGIRRAPVEDGGELIGMIALSSLILDNELY